jgi:hypothetical protein
MTEKNGITSASGWLFKKKAGQMFVEYIMQM